MKQALIVQASPRGTESASRQVTNRLRERLKSQYPSAKLIERDLAGDPPPHLDYATLTALSSNNATAGKQATQTAPLADTLTEEVMSSDFLVIASPTWNFGLPSSLKAWIDHVVRAGKTFRYANGGVEGLAVGKRAILVIASGGVFSEGPWRPWDTVEPYLREILGFIGINDVQIIRAEGMNIPELAPDAIGKGADAVAAIAI